MNLPPYNRTPRVFAHRGTGLLAPENTVAAFNFALRHQSDVLETDVRLWRAPPMVRDRSAMRRYVTDRADIARSQLVD